MSAGHLYDELKAAIARARRGGDRQRLAERQVKCPLVGSALVRADGNLYQPDEAGAEAYIFSVLARTHVCAGGHLTADPTPRDLAGAAVPLVDLAAWRPSKPRSVLLRRGSVSALGWDLDTGETHEALQLWTLPTSWAAADFRGLVVIDWPRVSPRLLEWREIVADTLELGERLEAELARARRRLTPRWPRILIGAAA